MHFVSYTFPFFLSAAMENSALRIYMYLIILRDQMDGPFGTFLTYQEKMPNSQAYSASFCGTLSVIELIFQNVQCAFIKGRCLVQFYKVV